MESKKFLITCVEALSSFPQTVEAVYPRMDIQQCIPHHICNTTRFVSYKEIRYLMADLKKLYAAPIEEAALSELNSIDEK